MQISQEMPDSIYKKFHSLIYECSGISFNDVNRSSLEAKILSRTRTLEYKNINNYYDFVDKDKKEQDILVGVITTNLTSFFRTPMHFMALKDFMLSKIITHKKTHKQDLSIKAWSAGCSTGEEAYSLAIWLTEYLPSRCKLQILATDINLTCLEKAENAEYSAEKCKDIDPQLLEKYFTKNLLTYTVINKIKNLISFDHNNLVLNKQLEKFDIIFCRNVMIYFDKMSQKKLLDNLYRAMIPEHSYLVLGHTSSLESIYDLSLPKGILKTPYLTIYHRNE